MLKLTITTETYSRTESGKSWRSTPYETETETLPWHREDTESVTDPYGEDKHRKITEPDTLRWFRHIGGTEYVERSYTPVGFIVTRLTSTSPDRTVRKVRKFRVTDDA